MLPAEMGLVSTAGCACVSIHVHTRVSVVCVMHVHVCMRVCVHARFRA